MEIGVSSHVNPLKDLINQMVDFLHFFKNRRDESSSYIEIASFLISVKGPLWNVVYILDQKMNYLHVQGGIYNPKALLCN